MKTLILLLALLLPAVAYANCRVETYWIDGKMITCTICCVGEFCQSTCR